MLQVALKEPAIYGLEDVNFEQLSICKSIKPYAHTIHGIKMINDIEYYPLKSGNKIVGIFTVCYGKFGDYTVTFDTKFANELDKFLSKDGKFALIHKDGELIAKNKSSMKTIATSKAENPNGGVSAEEIINDEYIVLNSLQSMGSISVTDSVVSVTSQYKRIDMPYIPQGPYNLCWAASAASIGEYYTGISKTATYVADELGIGYNDGGTVFDMKHALSSLYGLSSQAGNFIFDEPSVIQLIDNNVPIGAAFSDGSGAMGHAVVICGYSYSTQGMVGIVRDPNYSSYRLVYGDMFNGIVTFKMDYYSGTVMYWLNSCVVQE